MRLGRIGLASVDPTVGAFAANVDRAVVLAGVAFSIFGDGLADTLRTKRSLRLGLDAIPGRD